MLCTPSRISKNALDNSQSFLWYHRKIDQLQMPMKSTHIRRILKIVGKNHWRHTNPKFGKHTFHPKKKPKKLWVLQSQLKIVISFLKALVAYLRDACETNQVAKPTNNRNENFFAATQQLWPFVNHSCYETFHCAKLWIQTDE